MNSEFQDDENCHAIVRSDNRLKLGLQMKLETQNACKTFTDLIC